MLARSRLHRDRDGQPQTMLVFIVDISEMKAKEGELIQEKDLLEEANQKKSRILRQLSSEIRSGLKDLNTSADRLKGDSLDVSEKITAIEEMMRSCETFSSRVDKVLQKVTEMPTLTIKPKQLH